MKEIIGAICLVFIFLFLGIYIGKVSGRDAQETIKIHKAVKSVQNNNSRGTGGWGVPQMPTYTFEYDRHGKLVCKHKKRRCGCEEEN